MNRLLDATITAEYHGDPQRDVGRNFTIASAKSLWWSDRDRNADQRSLLPSTIRLSDEFFRELVEHPVPVSVEALRLLQGSPLALDIYTWLTHRNSYARQRTKITWLQLQGQFGSTTATDTWRGRAKFRETFLRQLPYVLQVYPEARVDVTAEGLVVWPSRTHIRQKSRRMDKDA